MDKIYEPQRKCIACRNVKNKSDLIRIVLNKSVPVIDLKKKMLGRGAYICNNEKCFSIMEKKNALSGAFKRKFSSEVYIDLLENLKKG